MSLMTIMHRKQKASKSEIDNKRRNVSEEFGLTDGYCVKKAIGICHVLYDFVGENANELSINSGENLAVTDISDEFWWQGKKNNELGIFPASYVELIKKKVCDIQCSIMPGRQDNQASRTTKG